MLTLQALQNNGVKFNATVYCCQVILVLLGKREAALERNT